MGNNPLPEVLEKFRKDPSYDPKLEEYELGNAQIFERHQDLVASSVAPEQADRFVQVFGGDITGVGVLDIGTGDAGVFGADYLTQGFLPPRIGTDIFEANVPIGWESKILDGKKILESFGANSFDHVQCLETLEHVPKGKDLEIARQMKEVTRSTCLITCCGLSHHIGQQIIPQVEKNSHISYKGQPNIEGLMDLGYSVRLLGNYQIFAWLLK